jgi:hypothetical protein
MLQHNRPKPNFHLVLRNLFADRRRSRLCPPRRWPRLRANPHGGTAWSVHWQPVRTANIRVSEADKLPRGPALLQ